MDRIDIDEILTILDYLLTKKKHIVVGSLFSISLFFLGGLAVTIWTLKVEDDENE